MRDVSIHLQAHHVQEIVEHIPQQYDMLWDALDQAQGRANVDNEPQTITIIIDPD